MIFFLRIKDTNDAFSKKEIFDNVRGFQLRERSSFCCRERVGEEWRARVAEARGQADT